MILSMLWMLIGCGEENKETDTFQEEPSSEPASELTDEDGTGSTESGGSTDSDTGSAGGTDGGDSGSSEGSTGDTDQSTGTLNPDALLFYFHNAYIDSELSTVTLATGEETDGLFRIILYDTISGDYCSVDWMTDASNTAPDTEYDDGLVPDWFNGVDMEGWYGFVALSSPTTSGSCDALTTDARSILDALMIDRPGFGYGTLTPDLQQSMEYEQYYTDWNSIQDSVFTGIASTTAFSDGERAYFPINQGLAYPIDENGVTTFDPNNHDLPQGTELAVTDLPADGFYVGQYYFGLSLH